MVKNGPKNLATRGVFENWDPFLAQRAQKQWHVVYAEMPKLPFYWYGIPVYLYIC